MLNKNILFTLVLYLCCLIPASAQKDTETKKDSIDVARILNQSPLTDLEGKKIIAGTIEGDGRLLFYQTLHWLLQNFCEHNFDGFDEINKKKLYLSCPLAFHIKGDNDKTNNICRFKAIFFVQDNTLNYIFSDIVLQSSVLIFNKITPIEKLYPEKKETHALLLDKFIQSDKMYRKELLENIQNEKIQALIHWKEIENNQLANGMNEDECLLSIGKPNAILNSTHEVQWQYDGSCYLFFQNGLLNSFIK